MAGLTCDLAGYPSAKALSIQSPPPGETGVVLLCGRCIRQNCSAAPVPVLLSSRTSTGSMGGSG